MSAVAYATGYGARSPGEDPSLSLVFVPFDDADDDDSPVGGAPLPPDDRLWRHPSELGQPVSSSIVAPSSESDSSTSRLWAVAVVAGLIGSALSLGVVAVSGRLSNDVIEKPAAIERVAVRPIAELSAASSSGRGVISIAKSVAPAIARLEVTSEQGKTIASAILVRTDGYLATNAHVVAHVTSLVVVLSDGSELTGRVVGTDSMTDIAVVKVDRDQLPVAVLGSATDLESGQTAITIGSPLGPAGGPSVTLGVISALGRRVSSSDGVELHDMIQTDAPTATGSSGGALCDDSGSVIGMTTTISTSSDPTANALGYAIPVEIVRAVPTTSSRPDRRVTPGSASKAQTSTRRTRTTWVSPVERRSPRSSTTVRPHSQVCNPTT